MAQVLLHTPSEEYLAQDSDNEVLLRIEHDLEQVEHIFDARAEMWDQNSRFYQGIQWTQEEENLHKKQGRHPYVMNQISATVNHLLGAQQQTRLAAELKPRDKADEPMVEVLNHMLKFVEQSVDLEFVESDIFLDLILGGAGASLVRWEMEDVLFGIPVVEQVPIRELRWDTNSTKKDLSDARWMCRVQAMTRQDAVELYPQYADVIRNASEWGTMSSFGQRFKSARQEESGSVRQDGGRALIRVIEHYERVLEPRYVVYDDIAGEVFDHDTEQQAIDEVNGRVQAYLDGDVPNLLDENGDMAVTYIPVGRQAIIQSVVIGDEVVAHTATDLPDFPYQVAFGYFHDGNYWGFVDTLIDPQVLINRSFSQLDYQLGTSVKNALMVKPNRLKTGYTMEKLRREISKTAPLIPVKSEDAISAIPSPSPKPELFQSITYGIQTMQEMAGGRSALGLSESASESGRAVMARAEAGGIGKLPLYDNLRMWRKKTTSLIVWFLKNFVSDQQVFRVLGSNFNGFVKLDDGVLDSMREIEVDIYIDEATKSETMKERYFEQLSKLFAQMAIPGEIAVDLMLEHSALPESKIEQIRKRLDFYQEYMAKQQQMQEEQKINEQVDKSLAKSQLRKEKMAQIEAEEGADIEELQSMTPLQRKQYLDSINTPQEIEAHVASRGLRMMGAN